MITRRVIGLFIALVILLAGIWSVTAERAPITEGEAYGIAQRKLGRLPPEALGETFWPPKVTPQYEGEGEDPTSWLFEYSSRGRPRYGVRLLVSRWGGSEFVFFGRLLTKEEAREQADTQLRSFCNARGLLPESFRFSAAKQVVDSALVSTSTPGWTFEYDSSNGMEAEVTIAVLEDGGYYIRLRSQDGVVREEGEINLMN
jgi:hypothetical protein